MKMTLMAVPLIDEFDGVQFPIAMDKVKSCPPYGLYLLHAILAAAGHDVTLCDLICAGAIDRGRIAAAVGTSDVIGIAATSLNWPAVLDTVRVIRRLDAAIPIVLGGVHASTYATHILGTVPVDYVLRGEADHSLVAFLEALQGRRALREVPGLCFRDGDTVVRVPQARPRDGAALAALPLPSYDAIPSGHYEALGIESSRGCGYSCAFCSTVSRGNWRALSPDAFIARAKGIAPLASRAKTNVMQIVDDCFTMDVERAIAILDRWRAELPDVPLTLDGRADNMRDPRLVAALHGLVNHMLIGAECGYEDGLARVRKGTTLADLTESARLAHEGGISEACVYSFVVGFPWESYDDCMRTVAFAADLKFRYGVRLYVQWFNTIPGSALWNALRREGRVALDDYDAYGFFRNARLFYAGVRLTPAEIARITEAVASINKLLAIVDGGRDRIEYNNILDALDDDASAAA